MDIRLFVLFCMVFCHIVDDYYLQGWLASAKQKEWWKKNAPQPIYKHDYIVALFMHSFSWSFMIMLPTVVHDLVKGSHVWPYFPLVFVLNLIVHMMADELKANRKVLNLIEDQLIHSYQIFATWILWW